jgi:hypothetical protein
VRCLRDTSRVRRLAGISRPRFWRWSLRLLVSRDFHRHLNRMIRTARRTCADPQLGGWIDFVSGALVYILVRHTRPAVVIETGVGPGGTTAFILLALAHNHKGTLHSIDLPGNDALVYPPLGRAFNIHVPESLETGWLVPPGLKDRWELVLGDSREKLPEVLQAVDRVDVFLHDSLHTNEHILMEFEAVLPHMSDGGLLLCDDVKESWSLAFLRLCDDRGLAHVRFKGRLGVAILPADHRSKLSTALARRRQAAVHGAGQ